MSTAKKKKSGSKSGGGASFGGKERRRAERRPILETFALSAVIESKGGHQLPIHDLSELGIGFDFDTEGELTVHSPLKEGDRVEVLVFLNRSLSIPLEVRVMRLRDESGVRRVGAEITNKKSAGAKAIGAFLRMLDEILPAAKITSQ